MPVGLDCVSGVIGESPGGPGGWSNLAPSWSNSGAQPSSESTYGLTKAAAEAVHIEVINN